jgi:hypothetical protein
MSGTPFEQAPEVIWTEAKLGKTRRGKPSVLSLPIQKKDTGSHLSSPDGSPQKRQRTGGISPVKGMIDAQSIVNLDDGPGPSLNSNDSINLAELGEISVRHVLYITLGLTSILLGIN